MSPFPVPLVTILWPRRARVGRSVGMASAATPRSSGTQIGGVQRQRQQSVLLITYLAPADAVAITIGDRPSCSRVMNPSWPALRHGRSHLFALLVAQSA